MSNLLLGKDVSTFMSRDGGLHWFEIAKGSHIYEIGNYGGLIVIAQDDVPTNLIKYSWDEGLTWEDYTISEENFNIKNPHSITQIQSKRYNKSFLVFYTKDLRIFTF